MYPSQWLTLIKEALRETPLTKRYTDARLVEHFGFAQDRFYESLMLQSTAGLLDTATLTLGDETGTVTEPEYVQSVLTVRDETNDVELGRVDLTDPVDDGYDRQLGGKVHYIDLASENSYAFTFNRYPPHPHQGTAQAVADSTHITLATSATHGSVEILNDYYNQAQVQIYSATTGANEIKRITDYVGSTKVATVDAWGTTPTGTVVYWIRSVFGEYVQQYLCLDAACFLLALERQGAAYALLDIERKKMFQTALSSTLNWCRYEPNAKPPRHAADDREYLT